ncbi:hypothetical protein ALC57_10502 [Trachymyrmex cornetzi]|uniref:Uncharacterized protein n=1 Tax=Trachymyrmex cornetzi TaxID=471704 RepID=A0A151J450_9HYME|nr:hypothetical protein ALC57_10502 [Trachymyrmex cornetzi]
MEYLVHIIRDILEEEDFMDIVDEIIDEEVNFEDIMDDDEDVAALPDDDGYDSDQSGNQNDGDIKSKIVQPEEIMALNELSKQCAVYFYWTTGSSILCMTCMTRLNCIDHRRKICEHVIKSHAAIEGKFCSECRLPCFFIYSCDMCPICTN